MFLQPPPHRRHRRTTHRPTKRVFAVSTFIRARPCRVVHGPCASLIKPYMSYFLIYKITELAALTRSIAVHTSTDTLFTDRTDSHDGQHTSTDLYDAKSFFYTQNFVTESRLHHGATAWGMDRRSPHNHISATQPHATGCSGYRTGRDNHRRTHGTRHKLARIAHRTHDRTLCEGETSPHCPPHKSSSTALRLQAPKHTRTKRRRALLLRPPQSTSNGRGTVSGCERL